MSDPFFAEEENHIREGFAKRLRERQISDLKKLLGLPEGRRFIWRVLSEAGVFRTSFTGNSTTFFNEGQRNIGLFILNESFLARREAFTQMMAENESEAAKDRVELEQHIHNQKMKKEL